MNTFPSPKWKNRRHATAPTYATWVNMIARCYHTQNHNFKNYGGRGIKVCDRWKNNYDAFVEDMGFRPKGKTIQRIDNESDYEPNNCCWATPLEQAVNRRVKHFLTHNGLTLTHRQWADKVGISRNTLYERLKRGDPPERALFSGNLREH